ncbi:glycosyltransferase [Aeromonas aquatilis]
MSRFSVTATVVAQNEEAWIEASILSIVDLVDEIVIIDDASEDRTLEIATSLSDKYEHIKVHSFPAKYTIENYGELKRFAISQSKNEWILRWDADFIAYDHDLNNISMMLDCAINGSFDVYLMQGPNLFGASNKFLVGKETFGYEPYVFKRSAVRIYCDGKFSDRFSINTGCTYTNYPKAAFLHMNLLKPLKKQVFRSRMTEFHIDIDKPVGVNTYWQWLHYKKSGEVIDDESKVINSAINYLKKREFELGDFDFERWGPHPKILDNYSHLIERYKVVESNGKFIIDHPEE